MPEADAEATAPSKAFRAPGATTPGRDRLAGASIASVGTVLPSGRAETGRWSATAVVGPTPAKDAVTAAESSASGTSAVALWKRDAAMWCLSLVRVSRPWLVLPQARDTRTNEAVRTRLRRGSRRDQRAPGPPRRTRAGGLGDNGRVNGPTDRSEDLFRRARAVTPGGVNSP